MSARRWQQGSICPPVRPQQRRWGMPCIAGRTPAYLDSAIDALFVER